METLELSTEQANALNMLRSGENVFLTGAAGTGKSTVVRQFVKETNSKLFPVLASTGAAAVLVGGRTFHSFFGLGIMDGGLDRVVERATGNKRVVSRIKNVEGIIIDEISMLSGETLKAAELISRMCRGEPSLPWGGMQVIAVGDFAQLPPVERGYGHQKPWAFKDPVWKRSGFVNCMLTKIQRSQDVEFLEVLNQVRVGDVTPQVQEFLDSRSADVSEAFSATRLFPRRNQTEKFNKIKLDEIESELVSFPSEYMGRARDVDKLKKQSPVPEVLQLKQGAFLMMRQNDPKQRWVNGSLGYLEEIIDDKLLIRLVHNDRFVALEKATFSMLDAEGEVIAAIRNFPVSLAYAATIHKAQGLTLDAAVVDVSSLWEPGQAYVALSRVTHTEGLYIHNWDRRSIKADPAVTHFYSSILSDSSIG